MSRFGLFGKLLTLSALMIIGFAVLTGVASHRIHQSIRTERIDKIRNLTEAAVSQVQSAYGRYKTGELTEAAAQKFVKDALRVIKFGNEDYYFIYDYDGNNVMHGSKPEREGKNFYMEVDANGKQYVKAQIDRALDGTGVTDFLFPRLGSNVAVPKISYQIAFAPWRWVIGTGVYVDDINSSFAEVSWQFFTIVVAVGVVLTACAASWCYYLSRRITDPRFRPARFTEQPRSEAPLPAHLFDPRLKGEVDAKKARAEAVRPEVLVNMTWPSRRKPIPLRPVSTTGGR